MNWISGVLVLVMTWSAGGVDNSKAGKENADKIEALLAHYCALPMSSYSEDKETFEIRRGLLRQLQAMPADAPAAIGIAMAEMEQPERRWELVSVLQSIRTPASAEVCVKMMKDPELRVRIRALHALRLMSMKTNRIGFERRIVEKTIPAAVDGLLPHLIVAANDEDEIIRSSALFALADTREPEAVAELHRRLKDSSEKVQLYAACFLTEFNDASGLPVMRATLRRLREEDRNPIDGYLQVQMLVASFERITGKSFGEIPSNPMFLSEGQQVQRVERKFDYLLDCWSGWWAWEPPAPPLFDESGAPESNNPVTTRGSDGSCQGRARP